MTKDPPGSQPPAPSPARPPTRPMVHLCLQVNGEAAPVSFYPEKTLLEVLREDLGLCGTKHGCELGECGACAVLLDGAPVLSCLQLAVECEGREIVTVEGLAQGPELHPLQAALADWGAAQCGYCTPGILCTAKALLAEAPAPSRAQIHEALSGHLCRCTGYLQIVEGIEEAARRLRGEPPRRPEVEGSSLKPAPTEERGARAKGVHG